MWGFFCYAKDFLVVFNIVKQNESSNFMPFYLYAKELLAELI